jgi:hypothetical protein
MFRPQGPSGQTIPINAVVVRVSAVRVWISMQWRGQVVERMVSPESLQRRAPT